MYKKVGRPRSQKPRPVACTGLVPPRLAAAVDRHAQSQNTSRSKIINRAIEAYMKDRPN